MAHRLSTALAVRLLPLPNPAAVVTLCPSTWGRVGRCPQRRAGAGAANRPPPPCSSSATCSGWICASEVRAACCWSHRRPWMRGDVGDGRRGASVRLARGLPPAAGEPGELEGATGCSAYREQGGGYDDSTVVGHRAPYGWGGTSWSVCTVCGTSWRRLERQASQCQNNAASRTRIESPLRSSLCCLPPATLFSRHRQPPVSVLQGAKSEDAGCSVQLISGRLFSGPGSADRPDGPELAGCKASAAATSGCWPGLIGMDMLHQALLSHPTSPLHPGGGGLLEAS